VAPDCDKHPPSIHDAPSLRGLVADPRGVVYGRRHGLPLRHQDHAGRQGRHGLESESPWAPCGVALHGEDLYVLEHINANSEATKIGRRECGGLDATAR